MAFRETTSSLRAYFLIAGIAMTLLLRRAWAEAAGDSLARVDTGVAIGFAIGMVFAGAFLPYLLRYRPGWLRAFVYAFIAQRIFALILTLLHPHGRGAAVIFPLIGLALGVYILINVNRLARESQQFDGLVTPPAG